MYFEEFAVDAEFSTGLRQITETDLKTFLDLSLLNVPIFLDDEAARKVGHLRRILPAPLLISIAMGLCRPRGLFDHLVALLGFDYVRLRKPSYPGDSIQVQSRVVLARPTKNPQRGLVGLGFELYNQDREAVLEMQSAYLMLRRPQEQ